MARATDWDRVNREARLRHTPRPGGQPSTQRQLNYIVNLAIQKGRPKPKLPQTKRGASEMIDRLLLLPDVAEPERIEPDRDDKAEPNLAQEVVVELRERFPQLTPMSAHSLVQLFGQIDPVGMAFTLDSLFREEAPEDTDELILWLLRRFLAEFSAVSHDEHTLVTG